MSTKALAEAIRALWPTGVTKHDGQAPSGALPWGVLNQSVPDIDSRSDGGTPLAQVGRALITLAAGTETGVLILADMVLPAYEGARVTVDGWSVSPLRRIGEVRIYPDRDVPMTATNLYPMVGKATFEYTVTRTT